MKEIADIVVGGGGGSAPPSGPGQGVPCEPYLMGGDGHGVADFEHLFLVPAEGGEPRKMRCNLAMEGWMPS